MRGDDIEIAGEAGSDLAAVVLAMAENGSIKRKGSRAGLHFTTSGRQSLTLTRAMLRVEAELIHQDLDGLDDPDDLVDLRTSTEREADSFVEVLRRVCAWMDREHAGTGESA
jgi:hypothetical protein